MGAKPDPYNFEIVRKEFLHGNTIILANYPGSVTFQGDKLMLLRGKPEITDTLDPHFLDEEYAVVARFMPTIEGWMMARACALTLAKFDAAKSELNKTNVSTNSN